MSEIALGRSVQRITYYTLPDAAWDRRAGLHDIDLGLDLDLEGEIYGVRWGAAACWT